MENFDFNFLENSSLLLVEKYLVDKQKKAIKLTIIYKENIWLKYFLCGYKNWHKKYFLKVMYSDQHVVLYRLSNKDKNEIKPQLMKINYFLSTSLHD